MRAVLLIFILYFFKAECTMWSKGVVHFAINPKHYDAHSQDVIITTLSQLAQEVCLKFFNTPMNHTTNKQDKILYISNPDKRKTCQPDTYDLTKSVVDLTIGYKCINGKEIARIVLDMLRSSIEQTVSTANSLDLAKKFQEQKEDSSSSSLLSPEDRNYINAHYHTECGTLSKPVPSRRIGDEEGKGLLSEANQEYYEDKLWPLGIVMYSVQEGLQYSADHLMLKYLLTTLELTSCLVFQEIKEGGADVIAPKSSLNFTYEDGEDLPALGYQYGEQKLRLSSFLRGTPGHSAHAMNNVMRVLGIPMMSNRHDRNNYVSVNWKNVEKGMEHLVERVGESAWIQHMPYDFDSITHAPANYMCGNKQLGATTILPLQDNLWQRTLSMGHKTELSQTDRETIALLYGKECERRFTNRQ